MIIKLIELETYLTVSENFVIKYIKLAEKIAVFVAMHSCCTHQSNAGCEPVRTGVIYF